MKNHVGLHRLGILVVLALMAAFLVNHLIGHTPGWLRLQARLSTFRRERPADIDVTADDVRDLNVGMDVKFRGYPVGVIQDIAYHPRAGKFEVKLRLRAGDRVCQRTRFDRASVVMEKAIVGPTIIELAGQPKEEAEPQTAAIARLERASDLFGDLQPTLAQLPKTLASIEAAALGMHQDLTPVLGELQQTLVALRGTVASLGTESSRTFGEATALLKEFQTTAASLNVRPDAKGKPTHLAGLLTKLDASANRLNVLLRRTDPKAQALLTGLTRNSEDLHATTDALNDYIHTLHHRGLIMGMFGVRGEVQRPTPARPATAPAPRRKGRSKVAAR